jgi:hypothetical protein
MRGEADAILKSPARVLACLRPGYLRVIVHPGVGLADGGIQTDVPMDLIPFDLRMPNSEFILVLDQLYRRYIGVERLDEDEQGKGSMRPAG